MVPGQFIKKYYPYAIEAEKETEIPAIATLSMAALESFWAKKAIGNNLFGVKYRKGDWDSQRILTTEYAKQPDAFNKEDIVSMDFIPSKILYKFKVYQRFADYPSPKEAFLAHSKLLLSNRYKHALKWKNSPKRYLVAIWKAGYATDPEYGKKICAVVDSIIKRLPNEKNIKISKKENLESTQRKQKRHRDNILAGGERIRGISAKLTKPTTNRMDTDSRNSTDGSRGNTLTGKKGNYEKTIGQNKTEKEVNSFMKFWLRLTIKLQDIKQFFINLSKINYHDKIG